MCPVCKSNTAPFSGQEDQCPLPSVGILCDANVSESGDVMLSFVQVCSDRAGCILVINGTSVFSNSGFKGSGGLTNVSKTTGTLKHVNNISGVA